MPRKNFWTDAFWNFERIEEMMDSFMDEAFDQLKEGEGPVFYGFSVSIGPDGKPTMQEFGNLKPSLKGPQLNDKIEPLTDVVEREGRVYVYAELPGMDKENIDLSLDDDRLTISAKSNRKSYYKEVTLPAEVNPGSSQASYKNGILEVAFGKKSRRTKGTRLKIE
jgi:HSP20 family protein